MNETQLHNKYYYGEDLDGRIAQTVADWRLPVILVIIVVAAVIFDWLKRDWRQR